MTSTNWAADANIIDVLLLTKVASVLREQVSDLKIKDGIHNLAPEALDYGSCSKTKTTRCVIAFKCTDQTDEALAEARKKARGWYQIICS